MNQPTEARINRLPIVVRVNAYLKPESQTPVSGVPAWAGLREGALIFTYQFVKSYRVPFVIRDKFQTDLQSFAGSTASLTHGSSMKIGRVISRISHTKFEIGKILPSGPKRISQY